MGGREGCDGRVWERGELRVYEVCVCVCIGVYVYGGGRVSVCSRCVGAEVWFGRGTGRGSVGPGVLDEGVWVFPVCNTPIILHITVTAPFNYKLSVT